MAFDRIVTVRFTEEQLAAANETAEREGISLPELIRKLLSDSETVPTMRQLRMDIDNLRDMVSELSYALDLMMASNEEQFRTILMRLPKQYIKGSTEEETKRLVREEQEDARRIQQLCLKRAMDRVLRFRSGEDEKEDPFHALEFSEAMSSLEKKEHES